MSAAYASCSSSSAASRGASAAAVITCNEYYARWQETVRRIVQRGQRQGIFRADADPQVVALRLTALTDGAAIQVLTGVPGMTIGTMRELLVDFVHQELVAGAH
ncbi:TetR family transcriptional regulator C-terminal domain-containing protein [Stenotrophomonas sp. NPDC087984]